MQFEDFERAYDRAKRTAASLSEQLSRRGEAISVFRQTREAMEAAPFYHGEADHLALAGDHLRALKERAALAPEAKRYALLGEALQGLPRDWRMAMPAQTSSFAWFFVRGYVIEHGQPVAYDPFWIEAVAPATDDERARLLGSHAEWVSRSGAFRTPDARYFKDPPLFVPKPFGFEREARQARCGACQGVGYVIGRKQLIVLSKREETHYHQELFVLCGSLEHLTFLATRQDKEIVRLHPAFRPGPR